MPFALRFARLIFQEHFANTKFGLFGYVADLIPGSHPSNRQRLKFYCTRSENIFANRKIDDLTPITVGARRCSDRRIPSPSGGVFEVGKRSRRYDTQSMNPALRFGCGCFALTVRYIQYFDKRAEFFGLFRNLYILLLRREAAVLTKRGRKLRSLAKGTLDVAGALVGLRRSFVR